jgi:hypothetical protein
MESQDPLGGFRVGIQEITSPTSMHVQINETRGYVVLFSIQYEGTRS